MAYQTVKDAMKDLFDRTRKVFLPPGYSDSLTLNQIVNIVLDKNVKISSIDEGLKLIADYIRGAVPVPPQTPVIKFSLDNIISFMEAFDFSYLEENMERRLYSTELPLSLIPTTNIMSLNTIYNSIVFVVDLKKVYIQDSPNHFTDFESGNVSCYLIGDPTITGKIYPTKISDDSYQLFALLRVPRGTPLDITTQGMAICPQNDQVSMIVDQDKKTLIGRNMLF